MLLVPFIHLSVYLFRTLHPRPVVLKPSAPSLPPEMLRTLLIGFGACLLLYLGLVMMRYGTGVAERLREAGGEGGRCRMPVEPPANGGYRTAAYLVAAAIYLIYSLRLWLRSRRAIGE